ncbi:hypothetical protein [Methyloglobulus sp.]|uniref:hypothetical protein n=1 Tax=Methyloglobulus sp. TaxID=2518622 RepID=UPI0032B7CB6C
MYQLGFGIIDNFMNFGGFPIKGLINQEWGNERFPLTSIMRIILSAMWYPLLIAIPASIPLCVAKCFKSKSFYQKFKFFWLFSAFIFTSLTTALTGIMIPSADSAIINLELVLFVIFYLVTVCLALIPAYIQYKYYNRPRQGM